MRAPRLLNSARCLIAQLDPILASVNHQTRTYSSAAGELLYRDFIQNSLYHPTQGYFNKPQPPIRRLQEPINFNRLLNHAEYKAVLQRVYKQLQVDWLTPVEVFAPWYGRALARYMLECRKHTFQASNSSTPLCIVEVGGGTGTLAASVLDYIAEAEPVTYSCMSYTTIEISAGLAALQRDLVVKQRGHAHAWRCVQQDGSTPEAWQAVAAGLPQQHSLEHHCFVLMMEVLDNLPHDRVVRDSADAPWQQVAVAAQQQQQQQQQDGSKTSLRPGRQQQQHQQQGYTEILQPASDPLIQRCLAALRLAGAPSLTPSSSSSSSSESSESSRQGRGFRSWLQHVLGLPDAASDPTDVWLPTRCLLLLELLHAVAPNHTLIAADFDALPDIQVPGLNAPLVSGRAGPGVGLDYDTVLVPWGTADTFFPTNFDALGQLYQAAAASGPEVHADGAAAAVAAEPVRAAGSKQRWRQQGLQQAASFSHSSTADFMAAFAEAKRTRTLSGYNPLVQDWINTRIFLGNSSSGV